MTRPGIEPRSPGPLANTLPTRPIWNHTTICKSFVLERIFDIIMKKKPLKQQHKKCKYDCTMNSIPSTLGLNNLRQVDIQLKSVKSLLDMYDWKIRKYIYFLITFCILSFYLLETVRSFWNNFLVISSGLFFLIQLIFVFLISGKSIPATRELWQK